MKRIVKALLISVVFAFAGSQTSTAQTVEAANILQLVQAGKFDEARALLAETPHGPIDAAFLEAQILIRQGRAQEAVAIYRQLLAQQPGLIPVRQLLADTLFQIGEFEGARFHFRYLLENDPNTNVRQRYANALRVIQQRIPSGVTASFSLIPSSNINRGTNNTNYNTGVINDSSRRKSGLGGQLVLNGFLRFPQDDGGLYTLKGTLAGIVYSASEYNSLSPGVSLEYQKTTDIGLWSIEAFANRSIKRDIPSGLFTVNNFTNSSYGLTYSERRKLTGPNVLDYDVSLQHVSYDTETSNSGNFASFRLGLEHRLDATTSLLGGVKLGRGLPELNYNRYKSAAVYGGMSKNWSGGWGTYFGAEFGTRWYDADFGNDPNAGKRKDDYVTLTATVLNSTISWNGVSPRLTCRAQENFSNIAFYDYPALECYMQLTRDF